MLKAILLPADTPLDAIVILPAPFVIEMFEPAVKVVRVKPEPLPMSIWPFVGVLVSPVPPAATDTVPVRSAAANADIDTLVPLPRK